MRQRVLAGMWFVVVGALLQAPTNAADPVCVTNDFEVPWVHPGITFYTTQGDTTCDEPGVTLKKDETGCFTDAEIALDGSWSLLALDATSGACVAVCPLTRPTTRIVFSQSNVYACKD